MTIKPEGEDADRFMQQFRRPLEGGSIEFDAFAPGTVHLQNEGMVGYWFDEAVVGTVGNLRAFRVPAGEGAFEFTISVVPAGAIRGRVLAADGSPPSNPHDLDLKCFRLGSSGHGPESISL